MGNKDFIRVFPGFQSVFRVLPRHNFPSHTAFKILECRGESVGQIGSIGQNFARSQPRKPFCVLDTQVERILSRDPGEASGGHAGRPCKKHADRKRGRRVLALIQAQYPKIPFLRVASAVPGFPGQHIRAPEPKNL